MKRIGILTFHKSINFGSFLQCISLYNALKENTTFDVEIIDYNIVSDLHNFISYVKSYSVKKMKMKYFQFSTFDKTQKLLKLSPKKFNSKSYDKAIEYINSRYDIVITGSDEVWKINKLRKFPNIYWLPDSIKCIKMSYAASANRTDFDEVDENSRDLMKRWFNSYKYIGVRDNNTFNMIKRIDGNLEVFSNPDPTVMFNGDHYVNNNDLKNKLYKKYNIDLDKDKLICLLTNDERIGKAVKKHFGNEYKIISIFLFNSECDIFICDLNPFEWAYLFRYYSLCITELFHGTMFSIKNGIPFISIDREKIYDRIESKIYDVLKRGSLLEHYYKITNCFNIGHFIEYLSYVMSNKENDKKKMNEFINNEKEYFFKFVNFLYNTRN